jgi:hypothetical protein
LQPNSNTHKIKLETSSEQGTQSTSDHQQKKYTGSTDWAIPKAKLLLRRAMLEEDEYKIAVRAM